MPNWTTNHVEITGDKEKLAELKRKVLKEEAADFSFDGVIPMPHELSIESGSVTDAGMACFIDEKFKQLHGWSWFKEKYPNIETREQYATYIEATEPEKFAVGQQAMANIEKYGAPTWYEWQVENWGVKWGASETQVLADTDEKLAVSFNTPWWSPDPIFEAIEKLGLEVRAVSVHEGGEEPTTYGDAWEVFSVYHEVDYAG